MPLPPLSKVSLARSSNGEERGQILPRYRATETPPDGGVSTSKVTRQRALNGEQSIEKRSIASQG